MYKFTVEKGLGSSFLSIVQTDFFSLSPAGMLVVCCEIVGVEWCEIEELKYSISEVQCSGWDAQGGLTGE